MSGLQCRDRPSVDYATLDTATMWYKYCRCQVHSYANRLQHILASAQLHFFSLLGMSKGEKPVRSSHPFIGLEPLTTPTQTTIYPVDIHQHTQHPSTLTHK